MSSDPTGCSITRHRGKKKKTIKVKQTKRTRRYRSRRSPQTGI
jgi:hypothetical protein